MKLKQTLWPQLAKEFDKKKALKTVKRGVGSIILWAYGAASGTGNIAQVKGRMDSTKYNICKKVTQDLHRIMIRNIQHLMRRERKVLEWASPPRFEHHTKSLGRSEESFACNTAWECCRTRGPLQERVGENHNYRN